MTLTVDQVKKDAPDVAKALQAEGHVAGHAEGLKAGKADGNVEGATAERTRIQGVLGKSRAGHEKLVQTLAFDGKTQPDQAAAQVLDAMSASDADRLKKIEDDGAKARAAAAGDPPPPKEPGASTSTLSASEIATRARAYKSAQAALGNKVTDTEAVDHILKNGEA